MSSVRFSQTDGPLGTLFESFGVSHAAVIPTQRSLVTTSGQPGYDLKTGKLVTSSIRAEIEACFDCVEAALRSAGVKDGLKAAHKITTYLTDVRFDSEVLDVWRKRMADHKPTWVTIGVAALAVPGMNIEMTAEASIS